MEGYQRGTQGNPRPNQENPYARFAASSESKQAGKHRIQLLGIVQRAYML